MRTCSVEDCKNKVKFQFPACDKMKKIWLKAIRRPDLVPALKMGLCKNHFKKDDFRLKNESYGKCFKKFHLIIMHNLKYIFKFY